jgi:hypothetical protein
MAGGQALNPLESDPGLADIFPIAWRDHEQLEH